MARLPNSGTLRLTDIISTFSQGSGLTNYYATPGSATRFLASPSGFVPASGNIAITNFYTSASARNTVAGTYSMDTRFLGVPAGISVSIVMRMSFTNNGFVTISRVDATPGYVTEELATPSDPASWSVSGAIPPAAAGNFRLSATASGPFPGHNTSLSSTLSIDIAANVTAASNEPRQSTETLSTTIQFLSHTGIPGGPPAGSVITGAASITLSNTIRVEQADIN